MFIGAEKRGGKYALMLRIVFLSFEVLSNSYMQQLSYFKLLKSSDIGKLQPCQSMCQFYFGCQELDAIMLKRQALFVALFYFYLTDGWITKDKLYETQNGTQKSAVKSCAPHADFRWVPIWFGLCAKRLSSPLLSCTDTLLCVSIRAKKKPN